KALRSETGALERLPCDLEEKARLRVHRERLTRRDAEERGVEAVDPIDEPTRARVHHARRFGIRIVVPRGAPTIGGDLGDRVDFTVDELTERRGIMNA